MQIKACLKIAKDKQSCYRGINVADVKVAIETFCTPTYQCYFGQKDKVSRTS